MVDSAVIIKQVAQEVGAHHLYVQKVIELLKDGSTVPFVARYRKELTGLMDETKIREVEDKYTQKVNLGTRKEEVVLLPP